MIGPNTLVVVDDAPFEATFIHSGNRISFVTQPEVSGKGKYIVDYARTIGLKLVFT